MRRCALALVSIESALRRCLDTLKRIDPPGGIAVHSYKRNRGVTILRQPGGKVLIREDGYVKEEQIVDLPKAEKVLKPVFKREFPRSRKVRVSILSGPDDARKPGKTL